MLLSCQIFPPFGLLVSRPINLCLPEWRNVDPCKTQTINYAHLKIWHAINHHTRRTLGNISNCFLNISFFRRASTNSSSQQRLMMLISFIILHPFALACFDSALLVSRPNYVYLIKEMLTHEKHKPLSKRFKCLLANRKKSNKHYDKTDHAVAWNADRFTWFQLIIRRIYYVDAM